MLMIRTFRSIGPGLLLCCLACLLLLLSRVPRQDDSGELGEELTRELEQCRERPGQGGGKSWKTGGGGQGKSLIQDKSSPFEDFPKTRAHDCVNITQSWSHPEAWTFVCVNDPNFNDIAREVANNKAWEVWLSEHIVRAMDNYPEAVMLDIGSNIGPHSLTVAAMGREVVVLDAVFYNLALISLSHQMTQKGKVRILYNSISDVRGQQLYPYLEKRHQHMAGATYLVSKEDLDKGKVAEDGIKYDWQDVIGPPAVSVTTGDVLHTIEAETVVIKIDVEGHECKALTKQVLDGSLGKYVPYIFMEWANLRLNRHHTCDQYTDFLQSFTDAGYSPHHHATLEQMSLESHKEWFDVIWIHTKAKPIQVPK